MVSIIVSSLGLLLALAAVALQRLYSSVPAYELKRLSAQGDPLARELYRPVAHGAALRLLLWIAAVGSSALSMALLAAQVHQIVCIIVFVVFLTIVMIVLPSLRLTARSLGFAKAAVPLVMFLLHHMHTILQPIARFIGDRRRLRQHSHLYEMEDLAALLRKQKEQQDNRISPEHLDLVNRTVAFEEQQAADITVPPSQLILVKSDDTVGPILLDQLHKAGQNSFLVYQESPERIVGTLLLGDAVAAKQGGPVRGLVRPDVAFVHEDYSLRQVLEVFQASSQQVVAVINSFEEFVGTITLRDLLSALLGPVPDGELHYDSRTATAAFRRDDETQNAQPPEQTDDAAAGPTSSPEPSGVVE